jgi:type IV pilus assembly protein PilA
MSLSDIKNMKSEKGFTIVELLIVIVVIGILAAIVIVAYAGVTSRANSTDAAAAAATVVKKAEAYNADTTNGYPASFSALNTAASSTTYSLAGSGVALTGTAFSTSNKPATAKNINFYVCTGGNAIGYWDYTNNAVNYVYTGSAQGNGSKTALPTPSTTCAIQAS